MATVFVPNKGFDLKFHWARVLNSAMRLLLYSLGYLGFSLAMSLFQSWLLNKQRYNFPFPLLAAALYDVVQFSLAAIILRWRGGPECSPLRMLQKLLQGKQLWRAIVPCAIAGGLDIALSNYALRHVSLSFYTMVKSSSPLFVLIFAFCLRLERFSWRLAGIMLVIAAGMVLTVWNEFKFNLLGFALLFSASMMAGARWALTQLIIETSSEQAGWGEITMGPLVTIFNLAPCVGVVLSGLSAAMEGSRLVHTHLAVAELTGIALCGGLISFALILVEYGVVQESSVITFSIIGILKELIIITASIIIFGEHLTMINWLGAGISILGILLYHFYRRSRKHRHRTESQEELRQQQANAFYFVVPVSEPMPMFNPFFESESTDDEDDGPDCLNLETRTMPIEILRSKQILFSDEDAIHLHHSCTNLSSGLADLTNPQPCFGGEPSLMQSNVVCLFDGKKRHYQLTQSGEEVGRFEDCPP